MGQNQASEQYKARLKLLDELAAIAVQYLNEHFSSCLPNIVAALQDAAGDPRTAADRQIAADNLQANGFAFAYGVAHKLHARLRKETRALMPRKKKVQSPGALSLVPMEEMDNKLVFDTVSRPFEARYSDDLATLNVRLGAALDRDILRTPQNPFRPDVLLGSIYEAWTEFVPDEALQAVLMPLLKPDVLVDVKPMYQALAAAVERTRKVAVQVNDTAGKAEQQAALEAERARNEAELNERLRALLNAKPSIPEPAPAPQPQPKAAQVPLDVPLIPDIGSIRLDAAWAPASAPPAGAPAGAAGEAHSAPAPAAAPAPATASGAQAPAGGDVATHAGTAAHGATAAQAGTSSAAPAGAGVQAAPAGTEVQAAPAGTGVQVAPASPAALSESPVPAPVAPTPVALLDYLRGGQAVLAQAGFALPSQHPVVPAEAGTHGEQDAAATAISPTGASVPAPALAGPLATAAPTPMTLASLRQSLPSGALTQADENTIDLLDQVFSAVVRDPAVSRPIRDLIEKLQIPVLKSALQDKEFFFEEGQPARRMIELISSVAWETRAEPDDPLMQAMQRTVERVGRKADREPGVFAEAVSELESAIRHEEAATEEGAAAPIAAALRHERLATSVTAARSAIALRVEGGALPPAVESFLQEKWTTVMTLAHSVEDDRPGMVEFASRAMDDLVWSVKPKATHEQRKQLIATLPGLLKRLNKWLDAIKWRDEGRPKFFAELAQCHASIVRAPIDASPERQLDLAAAAAEEEALRRVKREQAAEAAAQAGHAEPGAAAAESLERGAVLDFAESGGGTRRARLIWISPRHTLYIFSTSARQDSFSLTGDKLAELLRTGKAVRVEQSGLVARALSRALGAAS